MAETARQALDRAARTLTDPVAAEAGMRLATELEPGCAVKVHGEWFTFAELEDGVMWLGRSDRPNVLCSYDPPVGERFVWF